MAENRFAHLVADFIENTPAVMVQEVMNSLQEWDGVPSDHLKAKLLSLARNPRTEYLLTQLIDCWINENHTLSAACVWLCLQSSLRTKQISPQSQLELVWTGPGNVATSIRRTDQALLELINGAKEHLLVVSFAVYKAQNIIEAIEEAIHRNVKVDLCFEDVDNSRGKISFSGMKAFSSSIFRFASIYTWPIEKRPHNTLGQYGSLHAKVAVADGEKVFISSANLTGYAMELNMEMGVMIDNLIMGEQINSLFETLIRNSILKAMKM